MTENFYYKRTDDYKPILQMKNKGCFPVPMIHTAVLINLNTKTSDFLTYVPGKVKDYDGPEDDIIAFAVNAKNFGKVAFLSIFNAREKPTFSILLLILNPNWF